MRKALLLAIAVFSLSACESTLICLRNDRPEWQEKALDEGLRFQPYSDSVSLIQDANDFSIEEFNATGLPQGINCVFNGMTAQFSGVPTVLGNYAITLKVRIQYSDSDDTATSCEKTITEKYTLKIN